MFENIMNFFKRIGKKEQIEASSKDTAKERLHLVLMQDRANVSADFLDMMRQEIIEVIKKYIDVDENDIDVRLTNRTNEDGTTGAPALYANIPITGIKEDVKREIDPKKEELENHKEDKNTNESVIEAEKKIEEKTKDKADEESRNVIEKEQTSEAEETKQEAKEQPNDKINNSKEDEATDKNDQESNKNNANGGNKGKKNKKGRVKKSAEKNTENDTGDTKKTTNIEKVEAKTNTSTELNEE